MPTEFNPYKDISEQTLKEIEDYLKLPLENKTPTNSYIADNCKHKKVYMDDESHTIECQDCKKKLDPYWYLNLLANEWKIRRYQDVEAIKAWRMLEQQRKNAMAKGHYIRPASGDGMACWDAYESLYGHPPEYVYYRGGWYAGCGDSETSFGMIQSGLARKVDRYRVDKESIISEAVEKYKVSKWIAEMIYNEGFKNGRDYEK